MLGFAPMVLLGYESMARGDLSARSVMFGFAWAMATSALAAFLMGHLYDRYGNGVLKILIPLVPLTMLGLSFRHPGFPLVALAFTGWGITMGAMEGTLSAAVARYASGGAARARLFGIFDAVYGCAWLVGAGLIGWLERGRPQDVFVYTLATSFLAAYALHRQTKTRGRTP